MSDNTQREAEEAFVREVRELLVDWYSNCPHAMKFTTGIIKAYKKNFPDDELY